MDEKDHLTGTIWNFADNRGDITADDGDWYCFKSKRRFMEGDRVSFDVVNSVATFDAALIGGPIPCINVRHLKDGSKAGDLEKLKPTGKNVNIFIVSKPSKSNPSR